MGEPQPERDMRDISSCWQNLGWHAYGAGPCFDTHEQAIKYRDVLDAAGVTWWPQDKPWPRPKQEVSRG